MRKKIKKAFLLARGFMRCRVFSFCPKCNSDAPEKDNCLVCHNFYGYPNKGRRLQWWFNFKMFINGEN